MLKNANSKYRPFPAIVLPNRTWPAKVIEHAPIWMSTDLRDGNQALFEPMNAERKLRMFETLVQIGVKEIEVAFPSASQTDFDFVRKLIDEDRIPADVTIEVLTQAREHLIHRTIESLIGARRAIVHVYNATARPWREQVFGMERDDVRSLAVEAVGLIKTLTAQYPETEWVLQYSPETFSQTEPDFALEICNAVIDTWCPSPASKLIINLPATVEAATPNVYADQVEFMHRHLKQRDSVVLSVHPHNDRGTAVAAAELAIMAGADRVEGCLFGNGERTGNVDLVTLALNLYTQGVDPGLDFADINHVARTVEDCTQLPIHPRHPYVGDLVFTAFSGSHQDAIKKGLSCRQAGDIWDVPYLPIDPADLGRNYESVIRVNSQSGKGGIAYLLEAHYGLVMPRRLQVEFSGVVQKHTDATGAEVNADELWRMFGQEYLDAQTPMRLHGHHLLEEGSEQGIELIVEIDGKTRKLGGSGNGPIAAAVAALGTPVRVMSYEERSLGHGADARAVAFVEVAMEGVDGSVFGVGLHSNIITASILALISATNRATARTPAGMAHQAA
ncbi:2-isopropylmalate synthase [Chitinimonas sp. PSY-7]|uniref:2-isopropylmalate synthase n=1 Tax=Chitinimonas sp. PSY-7 TaxID=3459088 RepID=UPI00404035FF